VAVTQYSGAIGITTDGQRIPNVSLLSGVPLIGVGSSAFPSWDIALLITTTTNIVNNRQVYELKVTYYSGGSTITTAKFPVGGGLISGGSSGMSPPDDLYYPAPNQVIELTFTYGSWDSDTSTRASDGGFEVFLDNVSVFAISGIPLAPHAGGASAWGYITFGPAGYASSYYIKQTATRVAGYGAQMFAVPDPINISSNIPFIIMDPPYTYPVPSDFVFPVDANILESMNFSTTNGSTYFTPTGHWQAAGVGGFAAASLTDVGTNLFHGSQTWPLDEQMLQALQSGVIYTVTRFTPSGGGCITPSITESTGNQTVQSGTSVTLSVTVIGSDPLTYQWYVGISPDTSNPIGGATDSSYTTPVLTETTSYFVIVTNDCGTDTAGSTVTVVDTLPGCVAVLPIGFSL
jgi:hypothetical protein